MIVAKYTGQCLYRSVYPIARVGNVANQFWLYKHYALLWLWWNNLSWGIIVLDNANKPKQELNIDQQCEWIARNLTWVAAPKHSRLKSCCGALKSGNSWSNKMHTSLWNQPSRSNPTTGNPQSPCSTHFLSASCFLCNRGKEGVATDVTPSLPACRIHVPRERTCRQISRFAKT